MWHGQMQYPRTFSRGPWACDNPSFFGSHLLTSHRRGQELCRPAMQSAEVVSTIMEQGRHFREATINHADCGVEGIAPLNAGIVCPPFVNEAQTYTPQNPRAGPRMV